MMRFLLTVCLCQCCLAAYSQDLSKLSEEELRARSHQDDAATELLRRQASRMEGTKKHPRRAFQQYHSKELVGLCRSQVAEIAIEELRARYASDPSVQAELIRLFTEAYAAAHANRLEQRQLALGMGKVLVEEEVLAIFENYYRPAEAKKERELEPYIEALEGSAVSGPHTARALQQILVKAKALHVPVNFCPVGEPDVQWKVYNLLSRCGNDGLAVFNEMDLTPILSIAGCATPEALEQLLQLYRSADPNRVDLKFSVLRGLALYWHRTHDSEVLEFAREELAQLVKVPTNEKELQSVEMGIHMAGQFRHRIMLPLLESVELAELEGIDASPQFKEALPKFRKSLADAIAASKTPAPETGVAVESEQRR